jgi:hypothetical protein
MINKHDAAEIAKATADAFRTRVSHRNVDITGDDYEAVITVCVSILEPLIDNSQVLDRQLNPATGRVESARK